MSRPWTNHLEGKPAKILRGAWGIFAEVACWLAPGTKNITKIGKRLARRFPILIIFFVGPQCHLLGERGDRRKKHGWHGQAESEAGNLDS